MKPHGLDASDEGRHAPGDDPWWGESWSFDFWVDGGGLGGYTSLTLWPNRRKAWYWAALVGDGRPLVTLVDLEVALPRARLEIRSNALWADHVCETPYEHWTVSNEAVAVALDDPSEAVGMARGTPTPLGFDVEWEATSAPVLAGANSYRQDAVVHGEVLVGTERLEIDARGARAHTWALGRWWEGAGGAGTREGLRAPLLLEDGNVHVVVERVLGPAGWDEWVRPLADP